MLTLKKCRELLGAKCSLSDSEVEILRDQLYALADISMTILFQKFYLLLFCPFELIATNEFVSIAVVEA